MPKVSPLVQSTSALGVGSRSHLLPVGVRVQLALDVIACQLGEGQCQPGWAPQLTAIQPFGPKKSTLGHLLQPPGVQGKDRASRLPSPHWQCQVCGWLLSLGQGALASPWIPRAWETLHASPGFLICKAGIKMLPALWQVDFRRKRVLGALVHTVHQGSLVYHGCCG